MYRIGTDDYKLHFLAKTRNFKPFLVINDKLLVEIHPSIAWKLKQSKVPKSSNYCLFDVFRVLDLALWTHLGMDIINQYEVTKTFESEVWVEGNQTTISLKCLNNKYLKFPMSVKVGNYYDDPCTEEGICPTCKFHVEIGALSNVNIEIIDIKFGKANASVPTIPDVVASKKIINVGNEPITDALTVRLVTN